MGRYDHKKIEKKWQGEWEKTGAFRASEDSNKPKDYLLIEFPYPSGDGLHVGHVRSWTALDVVARKRRGEGKNVLYPIGWDAFGLPTENYAIKTGKDPRIVTKENTDNFRRQIKSLGISFDWSREVNTTDPLYYKWTQWIFLQLYKKGLAYKARTNINWCPKDKIGLANEEVVDGCCERCGTPVEKREKEQWMLAITKYAQRLYDDLDTVDYIERAKVQQRNWIGPSEGAEIDFPVAGSSEKITVFTTRVDTIFGATYMVLAPEHALVQQWLGSSVITNADEVLSYIAATKKKSEMERSADTKEKTGVELKGVRAINPATKEEIPLYIGDYVLSTYGTGAIMAVPAHDERDYVFAKTYTIPIKQVVMPDSMDVHNATREGVEDVHRDMVVVLLENSKNEIAILDWHGAEWGDRKPVTLPMGGVNAGESPVEAAIREAKEEMGYTDVEVLRVLPFRARSRYYAAHKNENRLGDFTGVVLRLKSEAQQAIDSEELKTHTHRFVAAEIAQNITIGDSPRFVGWYQKDEPYTGTGVLTNSNQFDGMDSVEAKKKITEFVGGRLVTTFKLRDWVFSRQRYWGEPIPMIRCEKDGWVPVPEDQLPVTLPEVEKYQPTDTGESPLANISDWVNTTCPTCGGPAVRETDVMPNWAGSSWYYLRYCDPQNDTEFASMDVLKYWTPVDWYNGGMEHTTLHLLYSRFWHKFLFDIGVVPSAEPYLKRTSHGLIMAEDGSKMSKSKGNTVSPDGLVEQFGADSLRLYEMFIGPFDQPVPWSTNSVLGVRRFIEKVWAFAEKIDDSSMDQETETLLHQTIEKVTSDIEALKMNTAVSALMILSNHLATLPKIPKAAYTTFLSLLTPFAPHMTHEVAAAIGYSVEELQTWPTFDPTKVVAAESEIAVQINGKVRATIRIPTEANEAEALVIARADAAVQKWLGEGAELKAVYVPGRIINFVLKK